MPEAVKTPKLFWIIAILSLLWNLVGAFDYTMTQTRNQAYLDNFSQEQLDYYLGFPTWVIFFWALAIWSSVAGSILLLLRKAWAVPVFLVSLVSMVINAIYNYGLSDGMAVAGTGGFIFTLVIFVIALGLWLYARAMRKRGILT